LNLQWIYIVANLNKTNTILRREIKTNKTSYKTGNHITSHLDENKTTPKQKIIKKNSNKTEKYVKIIYLNKIK
jgi:hypothetical protein